MNSLYDALRGRRLHAFTGKLNEARPEKVTAPQLDLLSRIYSFPIEERVYQWDYQTKRFVEGELIVRRQITDPRSLSEKYFEGLPETGL